MCIFFAVNHSNNTHHADKCPTIAQLQLLRVSGRRIKIIQTLASKWNFFGYQLNFDSDGRTVDLINRQYPNDICRAPAQHPSSSVTSRIEYIHILSILSIPPGTGDHERKASAKQNLIISRKNNWEITNSKPSN